MNPKFDASAIEVRRRGGVPDTGKPTDKPSRLNLLQLPRRDPYITIDVERAYREAGCHICRRPIAKGDTRLAIDVALLELREDKFGRERDVERYYVHASCVIEALEGRDPRPFEACWDCGHAIGSYDDAFAVFTTHRFGYARLCETCAAKPRWAGCSHCNVMFPHWMVSFTREDVRLCDWCSEKTGEETRRVAVARKSDFQQLRKEILEEGVY